MVIFATGVVTGGLLVYHLDLRPAHARRPGGSARQTPAQSPGVLRLEFLRRAQHELDLTTEQQARVDKIIKESQDHTRRIMEPVLQRTRQAFLEVLTPEQRTRFEEMVKAQQQRLREQRRQMGLHEHPADVTPPTNALINAPTNAAAGAP